MKKVATVLSTAVIITLMTTGVFANQSYSEMSYMNMRLLAEPTLWKETNEKNKACLALNIYYEARGESVKGQAAVAWVTLNRLQEEERPSTICGVVFEKSQFSWTLKKKNRNPKDLESYERAMEIANDVLLEYGTGHDPTNGSTYFHTLKVKPKWSKVFEKTVKIGNHIFYKES